MILEQNRRTCRHCGSEQLRKNGRTDYGAQRVQCRGCGKTQVLDLAPPAYTQEERERILSAHVRERLSTRATTRLFGVAYNTLAGRLGEKNRAGTGAGGHAAAR